MLRLLLVLLLWTPLSKAHDLITADAVEGYLTRAQRYVSAIKTENASVTQRATAQLELAQMQDEIKELLNRDLSMHGKVQGLPSNALIDRLRIAGAPLPWSASLSRFASPVDRYEAFIATVPRAPRMNEALFGALNAYFYESFKDDPLQVLRDDPPLLQKNIGYAERLMKEYPQDANSEEIRFIAAILHLRAAREHKNAKAHGARAQELLIAFRKDYPESMRSAAVPVLLEAIQK